MAEQRKLSQMTNMLFLSPSDVPTYNDFDDEELHGNLHPKVTKQATNLQSSNEIYFGH